MCELPINIDKVDIKKIVLSNKEPYGNKGSCKYIIGYKINAGIIPLCIKISKVNVYAKYFNKNNIYMNLLINDKEILKKYIKIWDRIKSLLGERFDSGPMYNNVYIKSKVNSYNTNFSGG